MLSVFSATCDADAAGDGVAGGADACGCAAGEGWSSGEGACRAGAHTSGSEAADCGSPPPPSAPLSAPPPPEEACAALAAEGEDCAACLDPATLPEPLGSVGRNIWRGSQPFAGCPARTAAEDAAAERAALWGDDPPRELWNQTQFLWDEEAGVRTLEIEMPSSSWNFLMQDPTR